jgi:hypothetical protein
MIIGAAKSGTTALWHYLKQHPHVFMSPKKHTRFFSFDVANPIFSGPGPINDQFISYAIADIDTYHSLFDGVTKEKAVGEASHSYLYRPEAPGRILEYAPDVKLIAILRNPTERAFSHYSQMVRDGREPVSDFLDALTAEEGRIRDNWWPDFHYVQVGLYHAQLRRYFDLFKRDQIKVYLYEDFKGAPQVVLRDIFQFLGVDDTFVPEAAIKYNSSGLPKNMLMHASLQQLRRARPIVRRLVPEAHYRYLLRVGGNLHNRNLSKPRLTPEVRTRVTQEYFRDDIVSLERLLQRDLSAWLK